MIEIQCPVCGEYISDELDTCPFCQAHLKPLADNVENDENRIEPGDDPVIDEGKVSGESEQVTNTEPFTSSTEQAQPSSSPEEQVTDWLSGLERTANEEDKAPAWLSKLIDDPKKDEQASAANDEAVDWLDSLRDDSDIKEPLPSEGAMQDSSDEPISEEGIPEWMKKLQDDVDSRETASRHVQEDQPAPPNTDTPDWLLRLQAETQAYAATQENSLSSREDETPDIPEKLTPVQKKPAPDDLQESDETPEWLKDFGDESEVGMVALSPSEDSSPDWLQEIRPSDEAATINEIPAALTEEFSQIPPSATGGNLSESVPPVAGEELSPNGGEPDWLINLKAEGEASQQEEGGQLKTPISAHQDDLELVPGWLQDSEKEEPLSSETSFSALDGQAAVDPGTVPSGDLPDWLVAMKTDAETPNTEYGTSEAASIVPGITPAELPAWVQNLQPVESIMAEAGAQEGELAQITENDGPLAGLPGVLPVAPIFGGEQKPLNFSAKLRITDDQKQKASQLEQMLGDESRARSASPKTNNTRSRILRWVVSFLLIAVALIPAISGAQIAPELATCPPEVLATSQVIFGLPASSPVLLVFDYEPAYSGELEAAAAPLVSNLLLTGARLAILSTSPTGPALADYFFKTTQAQVGMETNQQVANLGYLAGGASGVLSFATHPSQTLPYALDGSQPWQSVLLQDVHALSDFAALIVLTDNSDTARIWVEQAGPLLGGKPMLMAISAQAEPMLRPYYDSHQVQGLVTGLAGGKAYEQVLSLPGLANYYWDSFSLGLLFAELVIILAGLWGLVSILRDRKPAQKEEE